MNGIRSRIKYTGLDDESTQICIKKGTKAKLNAYKTYESWDDFFERIMEKL